QYSPGIYVTHANENIPLGPYLASFVGNTATLGPVYRIHQDDHQAFMSGILPNGTIGTFRYVPGNTVSDVSIGVPVPSQLHTLNAETKAQPLKDLRITIKDIINPKGVKTVQGNRAWLKPYDVVNASSPGIQKLQDLGAVIVGKTKTAQSRMTVSSWKVDTSTPSDTMLGRLTSSKHSANPGSRRVLEHDGTKTWHRFRELHAYGGRTPFINPFPAARYDTAHSTAQENVDASYERFTFFRDWFAKNVVKSDPNSCSDSLFLIPMATGDFSYRNTVYSPVNISSWASFTPYQRMTWMEWKLWNHCHGYIM
ncbi:hypothetical protein P280DRAFT_541218, partial [Massarina eburnea CBS 473.64]